MQTECGQDRRRPDTTSGERVMGKIDLLRDRNEKARSMLSNLIRKLAAITPYMPNPKGAGGDLPVPAEALMSRIEFGLNELQGSGEDILTGLAMANEMVDEIWREPEGNLMPKAVHDAQVMAGHQFGR